MKPIIPANSTPFALRTFVRGMLPMEPLKVAAATKGAMTAFSSAINQAEGFCQVGQEYLCSE
jgi:hypothetical protein